MPTTGERLSASLAELAEIDSTIEALNLRIKELSERKDTLEKTTLPDLFNEAELREAVYEPTGQKAKRTLVATGSLQKDPILRPQAIDWLVGAGYEESFENTLTASYARGDRAHALEVLARLRADNSAKVDFKEDINHMTLKKIARERITRGEPIPLTLLGVDVVTRVKFFKR
jgi:hypothetical protein